MKPRTPSELRQTEHPLKEKVRRVVRPAREAAPAAAQLRGWAKSSLKSRNKS